MVTAHTTDCRARQFATRTRHGIALVVLTAVVLVAGCRADAPTGVSNRTIGIPRPRTEHLVCIPQGGEVQPSDTISLPPSGECPIGFDSVIWF